MTVTRRRFLKTAAAASAAVSFPWVASSSVLGANDAIAMGIVGLGIRGSGAHLPAFQAQPGVRVIALCDPDRQRVEAAAEACRKKDGHQVDAYADMRRLFDRKDIDAIGNATQNYWHGLSTIWACQAGKHVYCEKPLSHYIWEGRQMVNAARKYDRLVQCGTQRRSEKQVHAMIAWLREGHLGKIQYLVAFANKPRTSIGKRDTPLEIPESVDYDLWCGPTRKEPIYRDRLQYDCSFCWNTGGGESANQGVHEIDVARWCLGETHLPRRVMSIGGRFVFNDAGDCPNTQIIYYDYPTAPIIYEVHNLRAAKDSNDIPKYRGIQTGVVVQCEGGWASLHQGVAYDTQGKKIQEFESGGDHFANFIDAVRAGDRSKLNAEVLEGHLSTRICHTGNISYRLGAQASQGEIRRQIQDIPVWSETFDRLVEHLKAHEVDVDSPSITIGPWLETDEANECFKDNAQANELVHGYYREPYVVPAISET
jgi:predicted dehydrogenase